MNFLNRTAKYENLKLTLLGAGQMFGEEDVIRERPYTTSVTCKSNTGSVFCWKSTEFFRRMKSNEESWKYVKRQSRAKET